MARTVRGWSPFAVVAVVITVAFVCALWSPAGSGGRSATHAPAPAAAVPACDVGAYVADLYDLDPAKHSFSARVYLWSVCPDRKLDPLPTAAFTNANDPERDTPVLTSEAGRFRDLILLQGTFRQDWDVRAFPFDRQRIEVLVTAAAQSRALRMVPDNANSSYNKNIRPAGWRITGFRLTPAQHVFSTNFGDTTLPRGTTSTYSRIRVQVDVARNDPTIFWKLTGPLYLMVLVVTATFLLPAHAEELGMGERLDTLQSRLAMLGGGLFVVMLNMQQVNTVITSTVGLTLIDWLHLLTLGFVLLAVVATVVSWRWTVHGGSPARAEQWHRTAALAGLIGYTAIAAAMVWSFAAQAG
ncbi:hypothetical protein AW27_030300 [Streptomyces sp. PCS3-D2]|uniref:hypothetical protein n=1 Tax=Streptomyces sp. PCS3-D2 TaxID=1460244 RepID=UPI000450EACA|nr:hypothetical protein [Streptomyces sp. PCS3-D2]WKV75436.1 hypothetical protein AW27_030300 [Streptomyces sp. PCS3-D2]